VGRRPTGQFISEDLGQNSAEDYSLPEIKPRKKKTYTTVTSC
jgi:hypothetical protein